MKFNLNASLPFNFNSLNTVCDYMNVPVRIIATLLTIFLLTHYTNAELIPSDRLVNWSPGSSVGVPGGIDHYRYSRINLIDVTKTPYHADSTGNTDASAAINTAIADAGIEDVVYLPAGTYRLDSSINPRYKDNFTIRGDGDSTILKPYGNTIAIYIGAADDWPYTNYVSQINGSYTKGDSQITMTDTSDISVGNLVKLVIADDEDWSDGMGVIGVKSHEDNRHQRTRVTSVSGNTITIDPPLHFDMPSSLHPRIDPQQWGCAEYVGVEDLVIDSSNSSAGFATRISQAFACWFDNVKIYDTSNRHLFIAYSVKCEIRRCEFKRRTLTGSNGAGLLFEKSANCLIEDNIITEVSAHIQVNFGCSGNVFAYNFLYDNTLTGVWGASLKSNHGPHNSFNLFEGNVGPNFQDDGYFGSASENTIFRNWFHGSRPGENNGWYQLSLNRFARKYNIIGNVIGNTTGNVGELWLGYPNIGNSSFTSTVDPDNGTIWQSFSAYQSALPGSGPGTGGFQERDLDVESTAIKKHNYLVSAGGVPAEQNPSPDTVPASLFRSSKPSWFGTMAWPPIGPETISGWTEGLSINTLQNTAIIPAQARYYGLISQSPSSNTPSDPSDLAVE